MNKRLNDYTLEELRQMKVSKAKIQAEQEEKRQLIGELSGGNPSGNAWGAFKDYAKKNIKLDKTKMEKIRSGNTSIFG